MAINTTPTASSVSIEEFTSRTPGGAQERREHCEISEHLRAALGLTSVSLHGETVFGQVRVFRNGRRHSAVYTVVAVDAAETTSDVIRFYVDSGSDVGGFNKLWGGPPGTTAYGVCEVWGLAPELVDDQEAGTSEPYLPAVVKDPSDPSRHFEERIWPTGNHRIALVVPHGQHIDNHTSDLIPPFVDALRECVQDTPTIWECRGAWGGGETHTRWHVTATEIDPRSFPGLTQIRNVTGQYMAGIDFRYAISLHGFAWTDDGVIIGGRATGAEKAVVRQHVKDALDAAGVAAAYAIVNVGAGSPVKTGSPWTGFTDQEILNHGGRDEDNIVNRLSPNDGTQVLRGGIQLELSTSIRENHASAVAQGLAMAMCDLLRGAGVYIRDFDGDTGDPHTETSLWRSPDVVVKQNQQNMSAPPLSDKGPTIANDKLKQGDPAFAYVRAYNRDPNAASPPVFANLFDSEPATLVHPGLWQEVGTVDLGPIPTAPPGNDQPTVGEIAWTPTFAGHRCLVCLLTDYQIAAKDLADLAQNWTIDEFRAFIRDSNWAAWRNYNIESKPPSPMTTPFLVTGFHSADLDFRVAVGTTFPGDEMEILIRLPAGLFERLDPGRDPEVEVVEEGELMTLRVPTPGERTLGEGVLPAGLVERCELEVLLPKGWEGPPPEVYVAQYWNGDLVGRVTWRLEP